MANPQASLFDPDQAIFNRWEARLNARLGARYPGLTLDTIEDEPTWDMWDEGCTVEQALERIVERQGGMFGPF